MKVEGAAIAELLSGSWRATPEPFSSPSEVLESLDERLQATGAGGLAWWRIRDTAAADSPAGRSLHDAFRMQVLDARLREQTVNTALDIMESAGVRPILAKGWAMARLYPRPGMRPYGDVDLFVPPESFDAASAELAKHTDPSPRVDLHAGVPRYGGTWADVLERSRTVRLGERSLRIFGPEDHLGFLSSHLLFHGAWRPLWLCDIALLAETLPGDFDWDYLLALPERQVEEIRVAVRLAHEVLGSDIAGTPWPGTVHRLPGWLPAATMAAWSRGHYSTTTALALTDAGALMASVRLRWPNAIEVSNRWGASYSGLPRLPIQFWDVAVRAARGILDAPKKLAGRRAARKEKHESR